MKNIKQEHKGLRNVKIIWIISLIFIILGIILRFVIKDEKNPITEQEFINYVTQEGLQYEDKSGYYEELSKDLKVYITNTQENAFGIYSYKLGYIIFEDENITEMLRSELKENYDDYNMFIIGNTVLFATCDKECGDSVDDHFRNLGYDNMSMGVAFLALGFFEIGFLFVAGIWRIFEKAGKKGYAMFIPLYADYQYAEIAFNKGWLFILNYIPLVNYFYNLVLFYNIAKKFNKSKIFCVGNAIIPIIFMPIIAFDESNYQR